MFGELLVKEWKGARWLLAVLLEDFLRLESATLRFPPGSVEEIWERWFTFCDEFPPMKTIQTYREILEESGRR